MNILEIAKKYAQDKDSLTENESHALHFAPATVELVEACPEYFNSTRESFFGNAGHDYEPDNTWFHKYMTCRVCGKPLIMGLLREALRRYETLTCQSGDCNKKDLVRQFGCCEKAEPIGCVCAYAFNCPEHGETHIGTHD
jgi:hypothetical protein